MQQMEKVCLTTMTNQDIILQARRSMLHQMQNERLEQFKGLNGLSQPNGIVFAGDSLTEFFPVHELLTIDQPVYNRGIRGFRVEQLLENSHTQIIDLLPEKLVVLIGTNNIGRDTTPQIVEGIRQLVEHVQKQLPSTQIYLQSIYPVNESDVFQARLGERTNHQVRQVNAKIQSIAGVHYIDMFKELVDNTGNLKANYTIDGIHLSVEGYKVVAKVLQQLIN